MKRKEAARTRYYRNAGTIAIATICLILLLPFFQRTEVSRSPQAGRTTLSAKPNPALSKLLTDYEVEIRRLLERSGTPGAAIAIVRDSSIVYLKAFGVKAAGKDDSVDVNTAFRIASVSKCFASFLTGILVDDGVLQWRDPVIRHFPAFRLQSQEHTDSMNISHVLSHTTGLPYHTYTNLIEEGLDLPTLLAHLQDVKPISPVGMEYSYQNVAYSLIAEVIRNATGSSYEKQMTERVFIPLGMDDASIDYQTFVSSSNIAQPHHRARRRWVPTKINDTYYNVAPAGGVNASISDLANWMIALLGHRPDVLEPETLRHIYTPVISARSKNRNYGKVQRVSKSYYALGWRILHYPNDTLVYHGGYVTGYRSEVALDPDDGIAICILANAPGELADNGIPAFFNLYNKYRRSIREWDSEPEPASAGGALSSGRRSKLNE